MKATLMLVPFACALMWSQDVVRLDDVTNQQKPAAEAADGDNKALHRAAMDYVEGFYYAKPELLERSLSKELSKFGYYRPKTAKTYGKGSKMNYEQALQLAKKWNIKNHRKLESSPKQVKILDRLDRTAAVKVSAVWGVDYMHLEKVDGKWKIRHVIWQSLPKATKVGSAGQR